MARDLLVGFTHFGSCFANPRLEQPSFVRHFCGSRVVLCCFHMDKGAGDSQLFVACDLYFAFTHFGVCFAKPKLENQVSDVICGCRVGLLLKVDSDANCLCSSGQHFWRGCLFSMILVCAWRLSELINLLVLNFLPKTRGCEIYNPETRKYI